MYQCIMNVAQDVTCLMLYFSLYAEFELFTGRQEKEFGQLAITKLCTDAADSSRVE